MSHMERRPTRRWGVVAGMMLALLAVGVTASQAEPDHPRQVVKHGVVVDPVAPLIEPGNDVPARFDPVAPLIDPGSQVPFQPIR